MELRCPSCSTPIPSQARYCPKCGQLANTAPYPPTIAPDAHPASAPLPRAGKFFLIGILLGVGLAVVGLMTRNLTLTCVGAGIVGTLLLTVITGDLFS